MNMEVVGAAIAISMLLVGWFLARWRENEKDRNSRQLEAYANFIEAWAMSERWDSMSVLHKLLSGQILNDQEANILHVLKERLDSAHARLMIYGSSKVVRALSDLYKIEDADFSDRKKAAYVKLLEAMRKDASAGRHKELATDIDNIMLSGPLERRQRAFKALTQPTKSDPNTV
ncbi:MAG: hypothetical protein HKN78_12940 [Sphingomonadaceae bacterium]|nr:hypothetical protein [Sphingomonadaceae bacterium]